LERLILADINENDIKSILEKMAISPERKILLKEGDKGLVGIIALSDIFNILNL
jgi:hypothetical protein